MYDLCITLEKNKIMKGSEKLRIFSCETHINQALDMFVAEQKTFPMLEQLADEEKLSTKCTYCDVAAVYIVADEK